jgi:hypothetical protein
MRHNLVVAQYVEYVMVTGAARGQERAKGLPMAAILPKSARNHW